MNERAGFLADILANPADDNPRLAYADWLRERDDPFDRLHGRFLWAGLTLARFRGKEAVEDGMFFDAIRDQTASAVRVLGVQLKHLLGWSEDDWNWDNEADAPDRITAAKLPPKVAGENRRQRQDRRRHQGPRNAVVWERGCVTGVRLPLVTWATRAEWLFTHCPLERIELLEVPGLVLTLVRDQTTRAGWRMSGELNLPRVPVLGTNAHLPATRHHQFVPSYEGNADGLSRDRAAVNLWDWTAIALTYLSQAAGPRWTGPAEWTDPLEADIYRGPPIKLEPGEYM
jgi:uncharacterized protein (TIGR02996 family)